MREKKIKKIQTLNGTKKIERENTQRTETITATPNINAKQLIDLFTHIPVN